jgi:hypothetical protein
MATTYSLKRTNQELAKLLPWLETAREVAEQVPEKPTGMARMVHDLVKQVTNSLLAAAVAPEVGSSDLSTWADDTYTLMSVVNGQGPSVLMPQSIKTKFTEASLALAKPVATLTVDLKAIALDALSPYEVLDDLEPRILDLLQACAPFVNSKYRPLFSPPSLSDILKVAAGIYRAEGEVPRPFFIRAFAGEIKDLLGLAPGFTARFPDDAANSLDAAIALFEKEGANAALIRLLDSGALPTSQFKADLLRIQKALNVLHMWSPKNVDLWRSGADL